MTQHFILFDRKLIPLMDVAKLELIEDWGSKHDDDAYDKEGNRLCKEYTIYLTMRSGYVFAEGFKTEAERETRIKEIIAIEPIPILLNLNEAGDGFNLI